MMSNKRSSRMSAWKAIYVIPLVGISLAATAETKVDYRYESQQSETVTDSLKDKDSENWYKVEQKGSVSKPKSVFTQKNLTEGRFIIDKENNTVTLIYFDTAGKELKVHYTGLDLNENIYMHNGAIVTKEMQTKAQKDDPEVVVIVAYLKDNNRVSAAITTTAPYVTGTINVNPEHDGLRPKSSINVHIVDENGEKGNDIDVNKDDLIFVVNGERLPEGFDMNTINPNTITSIKVLKTEEALREYDIDKGVFVITTDMSKASSEEVAADNSLPSFNGGTYTDFLNWVQANIRYPEGTAAEGQVAVSFTVSETGKVMDVEAIKGPDRKLIDEAVRVIASSPDWAPGLKEGKPTAIKLTIPVNFSKS